MYSIFRAAFPYTSACTHLLDINMGTYIYRYFFPMIQLSPTVMLHVLCAMCSPGSRAVENFLNDYHPEWSILTTSCIIWSVARLFSGNLCDLDFLPWKLVALFRVHFSNASGVHKLSVFVHASAVMANAFNSVLGLKKYL